MNISFDAGGIPWMVYGSFFDGIFISEINPSTGKLKKPGHGKLIAQRHESVERAIEGPYIIFNPTLEYYYLFVSYDSLFSNYNIRVARSKNIDGPYVDLNGNVMTNTSLPPNDVGTKVLGGYKFSKGHGWLAPGHNSVLNDGDDYFVVHHVRTESSKGHYLHVRKIVWTEDGWPLVSPERYAGERETAINLNNALGNWECVLFDKDNNGQINSKEYQFKESKPVQISELCIEQTSDNLFSLTTKDHITFSGIIMPAWDWELWKETNVFMGKDKQGNVFVGKQV